MRDRQTTLRGALLIVDRHLGEHLGQAIAYAHQWIGSPMEAGDAAAKACRQTESRDYDEANIRIVQAYPGTVFQRNADVKNRTESHGVGRKGLFVDLRFEEEALTDDAGRFEPVNPGIGLSLCVPSEHDQMHPLS